MAPEGLAQAVLRAGKRDPEICHHAPGRPQGQTARCHRCPAVRHVRQQEGAKGGPGHGGQHLSPQDQVPGAVLQLGEQPLQPPPRRAAGAVSPRGSHGDQRAGPVDTDPAFGQCPCPVHTGQLPGQGERLAEGQRGAGALLGRAVRVPGQAAGADGNAPTPGGPAPHPLGPAHLRQPALGRHGEAEEGPEDHQDLVHAELCQGRHHRQGGPPARLCPQPVPLPGVIAEPAALQPPPGVQPAAAQLLGPGPKSPPCAASTPSPSPPTPPWTPLPRCIRMSRTRCPPRAGSSSSPTAASSRWPTPTPSSSMPARFSCPPAPLRTSAPPAPSVGFPPYPPHPPGTPEAADGPCAFSALGGRVVHQRGHHQRLRGGHRAGRAGPRPDRNGAPGSASGAAASGAAAGAAGAGPAAEEPPARAPRALGGREPVGAPAEQRGQGSVPRGAARAAERAAEHPAAALRGAGVQRAARQSQPRPRPPAAPGVRGRLRRVRLRLHLLPGGQQTLQPRAGRDLRVRAARPRLPLHQRAGITPPSHLRLPRRVRQLRLLARHEVEEQILGQVPGDRPRGHRQCPVAQDRGPLRVEQGDHVHPQRAERAPLDRALRGGADPQHPRRLLPLQAHLLQGSVLGRGGQRGAGGRAEPQRDGRGAPGRQVARGAAPRARPGPVRLESQPHAPRPREELRLHPVRAGAERAHAGAPQGPALHGHAPAAGPAVPGGGERARGRGAEAPDRAAPEGPAPCHGGEQHHPPGPVLQASDGCQWQGVVGHQQHLLEAAPAPRLRPPGQRGALVATPKPGGC
ncbi:oxysterol-binding protein-related protein 7 isoform 4-T4 [Cyanocitta cristata]